ncbi:MAG: hypothetical protein HQM16_07265 [Deltaproteobacteria bacterium]|nr:hypothetical protein [Deltaproteobacteria bacterium]
MKKQTGNQSKSGLDRFINGLEKVNIKITEKEVWAGVDTKKQKSLKTLAKNVVESDIKQFSFILNPAENHTEKRKIERIYSKNEIRKMVCEHLIRDYQHEKIINAVTDYIYGIHVSQ